MKSLIVAMAGLLFQTYAYASPGQKVPCTPKLADLKAQNSDDYRGACREGKSGEVSLFDSKNSVLRIDTGTDLKDKPFALEQAAILLDVWPSNSIKEVFFNSDTRQWVLYDDTQANGDLQQVYLLPENFKSQDQVITLSAPSNPKHALVNDLEFIGATIVTHTAAGTVITLKNEIPTYEQMRKSAYEFYDVRSTGWNFLSDGIKNFPVYDKVKALVEKCDAIAKAGKKGRCLAKEEKNLSAELLVSTQANDPNNADLISFLSDRGTRIIVMESLIRQYRELLASQALSQTFDWSADSVVTGARGTFFFQYTYDLSHGITVYSPGMYWFKPSGFSVRYAYYPIAAIGGL